MKHKLFLILTFVLVLCALFTACSSICPHVYDNGKCKLCGAYDPDYEDLDEEPFEKPLETFTVTFDSNGGSEVSKQKVASGSKVSRPEDPTKEGYTFEGWYLGDEKWSFVGYVVTEDITLVAKYTENASDEDNDPTPDPEPDPTPDPEPDYTGTYPWENTNLIFQLTKNSNYQELPSTCGRYLAGDLEGVNDFSTIDRWVQDRNDNAIKETNVTVTYQYYPEGAANAWGMSIDIMDSEIRAKEPSRPDIYCNFVYDMVAVSLKGSFANLLSTTMPGTNSISAGKNYFDFAQDPNLQDTGDGYMLSYMRSLTLSKSKLYCLASDYFIDVVRGFMVVPVNIGLIETLGTSGEYDYSTGKGNFLADRVDTYDTYGNPITNYTIEDFYQLIYDLEWNYENLANFSAAIFAEADGSSTDQDLQDRVGFALGTTSGLGAAGMLYTTSVTVIDRYYDPDKNDYYYVYPNTVQMGEGENASFGSNGPYEDLTTFANNLSALFASDGVIAVSSNDTFGYGATDLQAIRARFASGNVLFGGIVCVGSLEYDEYREMNSLSGSGYAIAPVPLYRSSYVDEWSGEAMYDHYMTQIHSVARIGAISGTTEKFAQCSAYLNYQSKNSTDILNEYYNYKLKYDIVGTSVSGNMEILSYIRKNVRNGFDMTFENAIAQFYSPTVGTDSLAWHTMFKNNSYQLDNMEVYYQVYAPYKAAMLYALETIIYPTLPD